MAERYEYGVVEQKVSGPSNKPTTKNHEATLSNLAAEGWELVSVASLGAFLTSSSLFYLRRPLSPERPPAD